MAGKSLRCLDVVLYVNGLLLAVSELKTAAFEDATGWAAFQKHQTYQAQIPSLFATNAAEPSWRFLDVEAYSMTFLIPGDDPVYSVHMRTTVTIRTDMALRKALEDRARAQGTTISQAARQILSEALMERPLGQRTGHLRGALRLPTERDEPWRRTLRERNWRS